MAQINTAILNQDTLEECILVKDYSMIYHLTIK
jgi:hypothetical protein